MCGIAGILGPLLREEGLASVERMVSALRHRGPDGQDFTCIPAQDGHNLFLGHARLAILDLTPHSAQPMLDEMTGSWLVFNGEIYNYVALRSELEAAGHRFRSTGDTEVLLKALIEWGPEALKRLQGMYAFAFWDGREHRLILARDPLGIKPLLLTRRGASVMFASELRSLITASGKGIDLCPMGISSYLAFGSVIEPATIAQGVVSVPPGHVVVTDSGGRLTPPRRVVTLDGILSQHLRPDHISFEGAVDAVRAGLQGSVRKHLASDVPIGVFLSGGIDSSILATMADQAARGQEMNYLTVAFPEQEFSELQYAQQVASGLRGTHKIEVLNADRMFDFLPKALSAIDQPTVDGINTYIISSIATRQGIKVLLSGLGGDEIFGGYTTFWKAPLLWRNRSLLSRLARAMPARLFGSGSERQKLIEGSQGFDLRDAYLLQRSIRWSAQTSRIGILGTLPDNSLVTPESWDLMSTDHRHGMHNRISYLESVFYMRNQLLRDSDIFSSANAVELRVPYLDLELVNMAWSLPDSYHRSIPSGGKRILKRILEELQPGLPLRRRKMGFVFPWDRWLREPWMFEMVADTINANSAYQGLGVHPVEGRNILAAFVEQDPLITWAHVWSLFVLLDWSSRLRRGGGVS